MSRNRVHMSALTQQYFLKYKGAGKLVDGVIEFGRSFGRVFIRQQTVHLSLEPQFELLQDGNVSRFEIRIGVVQFEGCHYFLEV